MLIDLGVLAAGEEASSEDAIHIDTIIDESLADLDEIINFTSDSIPDWAIQPMIEFVAGRSAPAFDLPRGDEDLARSHLVAAKNRKFGTGSTLTVEYF